MLRVMDRLIDDEQNYAPQLGNRGGLNRLNRRATGTISKTIRARNPVISVCSEHMAFLWGTRDASNVFSGAPDGTEGTWLVLCTPPLPFFISHPRSRLSSLILSLSLSSSSSSLSVMRFYSRFFPRFYFCTVSKNGRARARVHYTARNRRRWQNGEGGNKNAGTTVGTCTPRADARERVILLYHVCHGLRSCVRSEISQEYISFLRFGISVLAPVSLTRVVSRHVHFYPMSFHRFHMISFRFPRNWNHLLAKLAVERLVIRSAEHAN